MTRQTDQIGFSQRVRLEWFEQTVNLILAGNDKAAVMNALQDLLQNKVSVGGQAERGNREKIITILLRTWLTVPRGLESWRDEGLELLSCAPRCDSASPGCRPRHPDPGRRCPRVARAARGARSRKFARSVAHSAPVTESRRPPRGRAEKRSPHWRQADPERSPWLQGGTVHWPRSR